MEEVIDEKYYDCKITFLTTNNTYRVSHLISKESLHTPFKKEIYTIARLLDMKYLIYERL